MRWVRRSMFAAWFCGLASVGLAWAQSRWYVFHPHFLPLTLLLLGLASATLVALACGVWRILRGPSRIQALFITAIALLPVGFWANVGYVANANFSDRWIPNTLTMRLAKVMGATFMDLESRLTYRHRLETERLVMVYGARHPKFPERVDRPEEDLAAMDRYLADLENQLGGRISAKVHWIRGPSLGVEWLSFHGLALGSAWSPEIPGSYRGDRHELAHAALDWFRRPNSNPPYVLHEGWAMANCGDGVLELAQEADKSRQEDPSVSVRALFGANWYYRGTGPVYSIGGAFVEFLIRTRGIAKFRRFYTECQPHAVDALCREIYGVELDDLENEFWDDVQKILTNGNPPD